MGWAKKFVKNTKQYVGSALDSAKDVAKSVGEAAIKYTPGGTAYGLLTGKDKGGLSSYGAGLRGMAAGMAGQGNDDQARAMAASQMKKVKRQAGGGQIEFTEDQRV